MSGSPTKPFSCLNFSHIPGRGVVLLLFLLFFIGVVGSVVGQNPAIEVPTYKHIGQKDLGTADSNSTGNLVISIDTDSKGFVYLLTFGNGVFRYNPLTGVVNRIISDVPGEGGNLNAPLDLAVDKNDIIYIADSGSKLIKMFNTSGNSVGKIGSGSGGNGRNEFWEPIGLAFDDDNNLFIVDSYRGTNSQVTERYFLKIYYSNGTFKSFKGTVGHPLNNPYRVAADDNYIFISHAENDGEVLVFNKDLGYVKTLTNIGSPGSIEIDNFGFIHVIDYSDRLDFNLILNYDKLNFLQFLGLYNSINSGINEQKFTIQIYDQNLNHRGTLNDPPEDDNIQLPLDLAFDTCSKLFINDGNLAGLAINFDLEIYNRTPSFDQIKPLITCPADITVTAASGANSAVVHYSPPTTSDNCSTPVLTWDGPASGSNFPIGPTIIKYTSKDEAGNVETCSFTITVNPGESEPPDTEKPVFTTCPTNVSKNADPNLCGAVVNYTIPTASDNSGTPTITLKEGLDSGQIFPIGTKVVTYEAKDVAGNVTECSFTVTVVDNQDPSVECPQNINETVPFGVTKKVVVFSAPVGDDNCAIPTIEQTGGFPSGSEFPLGTTTNTFLVTDTSGNTVTCNFTVTITQNADTQKPQFTTCPSNISQNVDPNECGAVVNYTIPIATDNSGTPTVTLTAGLAPGVLFPVGKTTVTYEARDSTGNTEVCSFEVVIEDNVEPVIVCKENILETVPMGQSGKIVNYEAPIPNDNCNFSVNQTEGLPSGSEFPLGSTINTFVVTDASGNTSYCSFTVVIQNNADTEDPVISCLDNIAQNVDPNLCGAVVTYNTPTATDNAGTPTVTLKTGLASGQIFPVGTTIVIYEAEDEAGNTSECRFEVTVKDNINPTVNCTGDITDNVETGASGKVVTYNLPSVDDNCAIQNIELTAGLPSGSEFPVGSTINTFLITDTSGNTSTCIFTVNIKGSAESANFDNCPETITQKNDSGLCEARVYFQIPTSSDLSGNVPVLQTSGPASGELFPVGSTLVTFEATGKDGVTVKCSFNVIVKDEDKPQFLNDCEELYLTGGFEVTIGFTVPDFYNTFQPVDNCSSTLTYVQIPGPGSIIYESGSYPVEFTVTDESGNSNTCSITMIIEGMDSFDLICNREIRVPANENCEFKLPDLSQEYNAFPEAAVITQSIPSGSFLEENTDVIITATYNGEILTCTIKVILVDYQWPEFSKCLPIQYVTIDPSQGFTIPNYVDQVIATDNCGIINMVQNPSPGTVIYDDETVVITAEDTFGNTKDCFVYISIEKEGSEDPLEISCPDDQTVSYGTNCSFTIPDYTELAQINKENATVTQNPQSGTIVFENTRIYLTATENGTTRECSFEILLSDLANPGISCPGDQIEQYDPAVGYSVPDYTTYPEVTDNCGEVEVTQSPAAGSVIYSNTKIILTATDSSGNIATCDFMLELTEDEILEITCIGDQTINLTESCGFALEDYRDLAQVNFGGATVVQSPPPGTLITSITTVKLTATLNGETDECTFQVIPKDIVAPILTCIDNDTDFELVNGVLTLSPLDLVISVTDNCTYNLSLSQTTFTATGTYSVVLTATDANGNYSECTRNINVVEPTPSEFSCRTNEIVLQLDATGNAVLKPEDVYTGSPGNTSFNLSKTSFNCSNLGSNTVIVTYSGENNGTCRVQVLVKDEIAPVVITRNISMFLNQTGVVNISPDLINDGTFDNCGSYTYNIDKSTLRCKDIGENVVTLTVTDASGNVATGTAIVTLTGTCEEEPEQPVDNDEYIYIYPNPTNGPVYFHVPRNKQVLDVELYDTRGRFILKKEFPESTTRYEVDLTGLQSSVYIFKVNTGSGYKILRVIVK